MSFIQRLICCLFLLILASCTRERAATEQSYPETLQLALKSHGGLERWKTYGGLNFTLASASPPEGHLIDLWTRRVLIDADPAYRLGSDGTQVWVSPSLSAFGGSSPTFYSSLIFYFFSMPFVMADPGINYAVMDDATFNGNVYSRLRVTFDSNVGESSGDQYILWFRKADHRLEMLNYSVTFFSPGEPAKFNALVYEDWMEADDLLVPRQWSHYRWQNDSLGDKRSTVRIENVRFSKQQPDAALFSRPQTSEIDTLGRSF